MAATPFEVFFDLVPTGAVLYAPVFDAAGEVVDFRFVRLNPAAQHLLGLPAHPAISFRAHYPHSVTTDLFAHYRTTYLTGEASSYEGAYKDDNANGYYRLVAQRSGELLVVSITTIADLLHVGVEEILQASYAREKAARAEVEVRQAELEGLFEQAPLALALMRGPQHLIELANTRMAQIWGRSLAGLLGRPHFEALPDLAGQGFEAVFEQVYRTGQPYYFSEQLVTIAQAEQVYQGYFNISYQPAYDGQGRIRGIIAAAVEVTDQVRARQQVQQLNDELEVRVAERTRQLQATRAEAEAQRAELHRLFMQAPAGICILSGPSLVFEFVNPGYERLLPGRTLRGLPILEALPELAGSEVEAVLQRVYDSGIMHEAQEMLTPLAQPTNGVLEDRYFTFVYQPRRDEFGQVNGILVFAFEVTEQVAARHRVQELNQELAAINDQLQRTNQELISNRDILMHTQQAVLVAAEHKVQEREILYQVFAQTPAAICIQRGPEHRYEYANAAYHEFFPGRQLLGRTVAEALPETVETGVVALLDHVYQTGETYFGRELPLLIAQPEGPPRQMYFTFTYQAYREQGEIVGISTFAYNVAEQVLARQQREAQQQQLQEVFEQAPVAIFVLRGPAYLLEVVNDPMCQILGLPRTQLLGQPLFEALPELADQGYKDLLDEVWHTGKPHASQEREGQLSYHRPGEIGYFNFVYQPVCNEQGQVASVICVTIEVTDQVRARQQVQQLNDELYRSNQQLTRTNVDLDTFVYTASHDLKAPITNIESIGLALRDILPANVLQDEVVAHLLDLLNQTVARFQFTITQLTDLSKLQLAHTGPAEEVPLAALVENVRLDLEPAIEVAGTELRVEVPADLQVSFSPANLRSIVYNLLSNAIKYRTPGRPARVLLRAERQPQAVVLTVQDNGLGLTPTQQSRLFGLFQRLHTHVEGTGVGLYIIKRLIENAGATITVQSELGAGSTFTVTFPL